MKRKIFAAVAAVLLVCLAVLTAAAAEDRGSICVTMTYRGNAVPGGTMTLYRVAQAADGEYVYCGGFAEYGVTVSELSSEQTAQELADFANDMGIEGVTKEIDENGYVCFEDLELGLYLMVQEQAAEGYTPVKPFLVTIPGTQGELNVDASPKMTVRPAETQPPSTTPPTTKPEEPTLPQTGQLNWPVPVLAVSGLTVFMLGWVIRATGRKKDN